MRGKKELLSKILYRAKLLSLLRGVRTKQLVIFGYHRLVADHEGFTTPFADDVFGSSVEEFEEAIVWFKNNVRVISEPELIELLEAGKGPGELSVMITFDDGYRDNYTIAYPILKKYQLPAVFFIPSKMIEERTLGWWDLSAYLIKHTERGELSWDDRVFRLPEQRDSAIRFFHKVMQLEKYEQTKGLIERLSETCQVELPGHMRQDRELMSWDELREVAQNGVTIGSHTHSHRVLATLDAAQQREELAESKAFLEARLGMPIRSIAYPVGGYRHFTAETRKIAESCGYEIGYSFCTGVNHWGDIQRFDVKRIGQPMTIPMLAGTTVLPEVFEWEQASGYGG